MLTSQTQQERKQKQTQTPDDLLTNDLKIVGHALEMLMKSLEKVDENDKLAKLNETTISDNNGGRIAL